MIGALTAFIVILLFAFSLYKHFNINPNFTPLISLTSLVSFVVVLSLINQLTLGVIFAYIISFISFILAIKKSKNSFANDIKDFFTVGVSLFLISSLLMLIFLFISQPLFHEWDEFSFWGTSQKLLFINDSIYTYYESSMIGNTTPPTLAVLAYFFHFLNPEFIEWVSFFSYDILFFSCYCAFTASFSKKNWNYSILAYIIGFFIPYFFTIHTRILHISPNYINTYADLPLGIMFAAALSLYFLSEGNLEKRIIPFIPLTIFFTFIKDMGFAFSLLVCFIIFVDLLFNKSINKFFIFKGFFAKITPVLIIAITSISSFFAWTYHMGAVMNVDRMNLGGESNMGMVQMLVSGVLELFSSNKSQKFIDIQSEMFYALFNRPVSMLGSGFIVILLILAIFILAILLSKKETRLRYIMVYIASFIGFVGYYVFHLFLYVYIFKDNAYGLTSYSRYIYPYYLGWLMLALFILFLAVNNSEKYQLVAKAFILAFTLSLAFITAYLLKPANMFLGVNEASFPTRDIVSKKVEFLGDVVEDDDIIYAYSGLNDGGERWFVYTYEYAQNLIVQDVPYLDNVGYTEEEFLEIKRAQIIDYLKENNVTHLLLDHTGEMTHYYLHYDFLVPTGEYGTNGIAYYEIEYIGEDDIFFHLIKGEEFLV